MIGIRPCTINTVKHRKKLSKEKNKTKEKNFSNKI